MEFKDNKNSYATFSDWFRFKLLHDIGGWWVDCDTLCIKQFNINAPYVFATENFFVDNVKYVRICNAVLKMPQKSEFGIKVLNSIEQKFSKTDIENIKWTEIGARILAEHIITENLTNYVVSPEVFCPNDYSNYQDLVNKQDLIFNEDTYAVHLWNKMWERSGINPLEALTDKSFLNKEVIKYL